MSQFTIQNNREALHRLFTEKIDLKEHHVDAFLRMMTTRSLRKKENLISAGSVCDFIGFVATGTLRSFVYGDGAEHNNDFYFENDFVSAYTSFLTRLPTNCTIEALTEVQLNYVTHEQLNGLIRQDVEWLRLSKYISDSFFVRKCRRETSFLKSTAAQRLEDVLNLYPGIEQKVSQYHIASYLGIQPESLSRIKSLNLHQ